MTFCRLSFVIWPLASSSTCLPFTSTTGGAPMPSEFTLLSKVLATHLFVNPVSDLHILVKCTRFCSTISILAIGEPKSRLQCFVFLLRSPLLLLCSSTSAVSQTEGETIDPLPVVFDTLQCDASLCTLHTQIKSVLRINLLNVTAFSHSPIISLRGSYTRLWATVVMWCHTMWCLKKKKKHFCSAAKLQI